MLGRTRAELQGDSDRLQIDAEQHRRRAERLRDRIAAATGRGKDEVERDCKQGRLLTAQEAAAYGLVQELIKR